MIETRWYLENTHFSFFIMLSFGKGSTAKKSHSVQVSSLKNRVKLPTFKSSMESEEEKSEGYSFMRKLATFPHFPLSTKLSKSDEKMPQRFRPSSFLPIHSNHIQSKASTYRETTKWNWS